jgi:hypothetical protein
MRGCHSLLNTYMEHPTELSTESTLYVSTSSAIHTSDMEDTVRTLEARWQTPERPLGSPRRLKVFVHGTSSLQSILKENCGLPSAALLTLLLTFEESLPRSQTLTLGQAVGLPLRVTSGSDLSPQQGLSSLGLSQCHAQRPP